jgi:outer membrane protein TolC
MIKQPMFLLLLLTALCGCAVYRPAPLTGEVVEAALAQPDMVAVRIEAARLRHPRLLPLEFDDRNGLSPDEAAVLAVLNNPRLRALRGQRGIAQAQLLQAGILPNPQLAYNLDAPFGGNTKGLVNAFGLGLTWEVTSLLTRGAKVDAAAARRASVELTVAWQEWQVAQAAKQGIVRLASAQARLVLAQEIEHDLDERRQVIDRAEAQGNSTQIQVTATEAAWRTAITIRLGIEQEVRRERLTLLEALGLNSGANVQVQTNFSFPTSSANGDWSLAQITTDLEQQRFDLLALRLGYERQDAALRAPATPATSIRRDSA